jgi:GT2 family glycosyltransferase
MNLQKIKEELLLIDFAQEVQKDILIVVHDQYDYVVECINSICNNTKNFNIYIWDNNSKKETAEYLISLKNKHDNIKLYHSNKNLGFILPNNFMVKESKSPYLILLNSDVVVQEMWDLVLIGFLQNNPDVSLVGYDGGLLNSEGKGVGRGVGYDIDYVCGHCMCFSRQTYEKFGLFDEENLEFAYCEDADFSLRLRDNNKKIYACHSSKLIHHFQNKTSAHVIFNEYDFSDHIKKNMRHIQNKWGKFLLNK